MKRFCAAVLLAGLAAANGANAQEADVRLDEVVVTATKTEKDPKDVTQSVTVITAEQIRKSNAATVADVVRGTVGTTLNEQGPAGSLETVSIRGSRYAQVLVLLDGVRLNSPRDGGVDLSLLPVTLDEIERIEIVRGPASALYGADAVGGVVNIITKRPSTGMVNRIGGSVGSHGYDTIDAGSSAREGALSYSMSGTRETSDGYRENSDLEQWTVNGKIGYDMGKAGAIDLTTNYVSKENGVPGSIVFPSPLARQRERQTVLGASYREKIANEIDFTIRTSRTENMLRYQDPDLGEDSEHRSSSQDSEAQVTWIAGAWSAFTIGYETRDDELNSTASGDHATTTDSFYLQDEIAAGSSFGMVVGTRYDKHSVYGEQWSPKASARYLLGNGGTIIRVSYGESFRGPTFNDLYWPNTGWAMGNPDLKPETAKEYEAGIEQALGKGSMIKITGFKREVENLIDWQEFAPWQWRPENVGRATIKGAEAEAVFRAADGFSLSANYTYMNPVDETTGEKIYYTIPKEQIRGALTIAVADDVSLTAEGRSVKNYVMDGEPTWRYSVYDAKISQKIGRKGTERGEIYFAMTNVFDRKYESVRGYPMPPREIRGGMMIPF